jgi:hypothetical protein
MLKYQPIKAVRDRQSSITSGSGLKHDVCSVMGGQLANP